MNEPGHNQSHSLLTPGRNCWRVETADRFAVLMENAAVRVLDTLCDIYRAK